MGNKKVIQSIMLGVIFLLASFFAYRTPESVEVKKNNDLKTIFGPVEGYEIAYKTPLDDDIYRFLDLDDYTSINYTKDGASINLYIGYYNSLDKVSAAHSPLVCFPGQGWTIDQPSIHRLEISGHAIHYAEMVAALEGRQELVLYWYQAFEKTAPAVFRNKINAMINMITGNKQEHAFVRVTVPFTQTNEENARKTAIKFITAFYPTFLVYINDEGTLPRKQ